MRGWVLAVVLTMVAAGSSAQEAAQGGGVEPPQIPPGFATPGEESLGATVDDTGTPRDLDPGGGGQVAGPASGLIGDGSATRAGFVAAMAKSGCVMDSSTARQRLAAEGFPQDFVRQVSTDMVFSEEARYEGGHTLRLLSSICPPDAGRRALTPKDKMVQVFQARGCTMSQDAARRTFVGQGFTEEQLRGIVRAMVGSGEATISSGELTIAAPLCGRTG